ncbi:hypothetical protein [Secundilactobacillus silagei]|uniref:Uncharacterized protein n=1 Tax=Secundilactobacillus silagei JCM 19001 TaxID=1302250 RepID=A0A1Z5H3U3_9LACO|nr:hypothetical protein [Secundilactobacillus silagei]TDG70271.1 hypothetical protein C5L25_001461 [Secundilactobacillus silagei JCM 19001]GAT17957.1 hypothetical protein IWT126_00214 [Secundilactobacillus silagei JCM 19001]
MDNEDRRKQYKSLWMQMKRASKQPGFNEEAWQDRLDEYRLRPRGTVAPSKTKQYRREQSQKWRDRLKGGAEYKRLQYNANGLLKRDDVAVDNINELLNLVEDREMEVSPYMQG